ncbi:MAG: histidine triad nucleotide-binding protein [Caldiserica bacterium]|nr:MAG: histidine triad nucleotide-binding protein [Caldisericota bacterium]
MECIFCKIIKREIPSEIVKEDDLAIAFKDINPQAPVHILIVPKKHIASISEMKEEDENLIGHLFNMAREIAQELGLSSGYRLVINNGKDAGQEVFHIHLHLLSGRKFSWPPG